MSVAESARIIGVSGATIRNWAKTGRLSPLRAHPLLFAGPDIRALASNGPDGRLCSRANRTRSDKLCQLTAIAPVRREGMARIRAYAQTRNLDAPTAIFLASLAFLEDLGELEATPDPLQAPDCIRWCRRSSLSKILRDFRDSLPRVTLAQGWREIFCPGRAEPDQDHLGQIYQGLQTLGSKASQGAFYTPPSLIQDALAQVGPEISSFLDPCCGSGRYLLRAARQCGLGPDRLHGFDLDPTAVFMARINLLALFPKQDFFPDIRCLDILSEPIKSLDIYEKIDLIATNPPWGAGRHQRSGQTERPDSFAIFLRRSLDILRPGGFLSFILPEAALKIKAHAELRRYLTERTTLLAIHHLGRCFDSVLSPAVRLDLEKKQPAPNHLVRTGRHSLTRQGRFADNPDQAFDLRITPDDEFLLNKIYAVRHRTLAGQARWALGIVTGDNKAHLLDQPAAGAEPIIRGRDLGPYYLKPATAFIRHQPDLWQQSAPESLYRTPEKLIYRFISNRLCFSYDNQGLLTLNSANIVIPHLPGLALKSALAFLNSAVFQYIFAKKFATHRVLKGDLEKLPFPVLTPAQNQRLSRLAELAIHGQPSQQDIDILIFSIFNLSDNEVDFIQRAIK